jgi:hypothetical protein
MQNAIDDEVPIAKQTAIQHLDGFLSFFLRGHLDESETAGAAREFVRDDAGNLIPDPRGRPYRQWREQIRTPDDIWDEIVRAGQLPGTTSAPKLQPIETRLVMLQTGMRAPMGVKIRGPNLQTIEQVAIDMERLLREVPGIASATVNADRVVGKPYLEIEIDRQAIGRYGVNIVDVQNVIMAAIGGMMLAGRLASANAHMLNLMELSTIAAVVFGGSALFGGEGRVSGTIIGVFIIGLLGNGLNILGLADFWQRVATGLIIILVVALDQWRRHLTTRDTS